MTGYLSRRLWIKRVPSFYEPAEIVRYLRYIGFKPQLSEEDVACLGLEQQAGASDCGPGPQESKFIPNLENLKVLMWRHLLTFPWENTEMHYSSSHQMDVSAKGVYRRFVEEGKGSYCFGQNMLFLGILRGLGFRAYPGAARVNIHQQHAEKVPEYTALSHAVLFVQMQASNLSNDADIRPAEDGRATATGTIWRDSNETFVVDVGFGSTNMAQPIPLKEGMASKVPGLFQGESHRLTRAPFPQSSIDIPPDAGDIVNNHWNLELTTDDGKSTWNRLYAFSEEEFLLSDYDAASFVVAQQPGPDPFWSSVLCAKNFVEDESGPPTNGDDNHHGDAALYQLILAGTQLRRRSSRGTEVVKVIKSEEERVQVLAETFGVVFSPSESIENIKGRVPEIV